jgi:predicted O-methyltransferase YrrM
MTDNAEVLDLLRGIVAAIKPALVVATGASAQSTIAIAEALKQNGCGRVITCERDGKAFAKAKRLVDASGLTEWVECRNEPVPEMKVADSIDLLFSNSSDPGTSEREVRGLLSQLSPESVMLLHGATFAPAAVHEAALRMEREGLISVVLLPGTAGLVLAQKRAGRDEPSSSVGRAHSAQERPAQPAERTLGGIIQPN